MPESLNLRANRSQRKYAWWELLLRVVWGTVGTLLFSFSPRPFFAWRRGVLRLFGAAVGPGVHIYPSATVYFPWKLSIGAYSAVGEHAILYNLGQITLGSQVTVSQYAHLCAGTHDHTDPTMPLLKPPIVVEDQAWICAEAFIGPGVTVGEGAIVGARAVAVKEVPSWTIVAGNPAAVIRKRTLREAAP